MTRYVIVKKGSNPPLYYVSLDSNLNEVYSPDINDADVFGSEKIAQIYCYDASEEIQPAPPGFDKEPPAFESK